MMLSDSGLMMMADAILVMHLLFILFVVAGQAGIVIGYYRGWRWVRNLPFRIGHLAAIGIVIGLAWLDRLCPLTGWENALRESAGAETYDGTFIAHWVTRLVYYDVPQWWLTAAYSVFGMVVVLSWVWVRPRREAAQR
jgi:hypothetical protein